MSEDRCWVMGALICVFILLVVLVATGWLRFGPPSAPPYQGPPAITKSI